MDQKEGFHNNLPLFHDEIYWVYSPRANLHIEEGPLGDKGIAENSEQSRRLFDEEATREEGGSFPAPLQLLEDKQHLGGGDCNVPKLASANWNINFSLFILYFMINE